MPDTYDPKQEGLVARSTRNGDTRASRGRAPESTGALDELSSVSGTFVRRRELIERGRQRVSLLLPVLAGLAVGFALLIAGRNDYLCGATFHLDGQLDPGLRNQCRNTLYDVASAKLGLPGGENGDREFLVDYPTPKTLRFGFVAPSGPAIEQQARDIAADFLTQLESGLQIARRQPSEGEIALTRHIEALAATLLTERNRHEVAVTGVPATDHHVERDELLDQWRTMRAKYSANRQELGDVQSSVTQLRSDPVADHGLVTSKERREAFDQDLGLLQDLKELTVAISEVRGHVRRVALQNAPLRRQLLHIATKLPDRLSKPELDDLPQAVQTIVSALTKEAVVFSEALSGFCHNWDQELTAIGEIQIDPQSQELFERYERIQSSLNLFLFDTSKTLATMRDLAGQLDGLQSDNGRVMRLQSIVSRDFQATQTLYHRFEFSASQVDRSQNFRLDAALHSASGLRRRSRLRTRKIEARLQQAALERMRAFQAASLRQAEALLEHVRVRNDETVAGLVDLQDKLAERVGATEKFVEAAVRAEMTAQTAESLEKTLREARDRLVELKLRRTEYGRDLKIELATAGILGPPINVAQRLQLGVAGVLLTFFALLLGQWWISRRT